MNERKSGAERRREILETMLTMAGLDGADRVTTKELAKQVGITEPALYRHFPKGKADMWGALASLVGERVQTAWRETLKRDDTATNRLRNLIKTQLRLMATVPALPSILFSRALHRDNAALRAGMAEIGGRFHARLEQIIEEGQKGGELNSAVDPVNAAWLLISVVQGTAIRWSLTGRGFDLEDEGARVLEVALLGLVADADAKAKKRHP